MGETRRHDQAKQIAPRSLLGPRHGNSWPKCMCKPDGPTLFPGRRGKRSAADLKRFWASICTAAGIHGVRVHDLRHSYASYLASAGLSLPVIGALLGHSSPMTTQRYAHLLDDPLRAATEKVGAMVAGAGTMGAEVVPISGRRGRAS